MDNHRIASCPTQQAVHGTTDITTNYIIPYLSQETYHSNQREATVPILQKFTLSSLSYYQESKQHSDVMYQERVFLTILGTTRCLSATLNMGFTTANKNHTTLYVCMYLWTSTEW